MLVMDRLSRRARQNDDGAVLITVVIVMFLGFLIAVVVAGSVLFTIQGNAGNAQRTQAFIAAESGRDAAYASITNAIVDGELVCSAGLLAGESDDSIPLDYTYAIRSTESAVMPEAWSDLGPADDVCPTKDTSFIVVQATGSAAGNDVTIDAVYPWRITPDTQPAGTMSYFDGQFKASKTTYEGDLVIRTGTYICNNGQGNAIRGDLWVLQADMRVTGDCIVTGSIYVYGNISIESKDFEVHGDVVTQTGWISFTGKDAWVGGDIYSAGNVTLTSNGNIGGSIKAFGTVTPANPTAWKKLDGAPLVPVSDVLAGQPKPVITPSLEAVYLATQWLEITDTANWGADVHTYDDANFCTAAKWKPELERSDDGRAVIDLRKCGNIKLEPGNFTLNRDVVFLVPSSGELDLRLDHTITKGVGDPQLLIVHADSNGGDIKPTCTTGADNLSMKGVINVRTLIYSACGINNTIALTMPGQLYMGNDGLMLNGGVFTCTPMSWAPVINNLSCGVSGSDALFDPDRLRVSIDALNFQAEH